MFSYFDVMQCFVWRYQSAVLNNMCCITSSNDDVISPQPAAEREGAHTWRSCNYRGPIVIPDAYNIWFYAQHAYTEQNYANYIV